MCWRKNILSSRSISFYNIFSFTLHLFYSPSREDVLNIKATMKDQLATKLPLKFFPIHSLSSRLQGVKNIYSSFNKLPCLLKTFLLRIELLCNTVGFTIDSLNQLVIRNDFYEIFASLLFKYSSNDNIR